VLLCRVAGGGSINRSRLVQLLVFLARDEEPAYKRRSVRRLDGHTQSVIMLVLPQAVLQSKLCHASCLGTVYVHRVLEVVEAFGPP
jgi:hypothetical protein